MIVSSGEARPIAVSESSHRQMHVSTTEPTCGVAQATAGRPLPDRDEMDFQYGCGLSLGLITPSPPHGQDTRGCNQTARMTGGWRLTATHPHRRSFGTARRIRCCTRKPLGLNPYVGKSCPDPGRLSTFGVSGLYPCRRLTYRGACRSILAPLSVL